MVAIPAVAGVVAALFALAFILAWQQFGTAITNALNVNLPIVGRVIGNLVSEGLEIAYASTVYWFDALVHPVADFLLRPLVVFETLFDNIGLLGQVTLDGFTNVILNKLPALYTSATGYALTVADQVLVQANSWVNDARAAAALATQAVQNYATNAYNTAISYALTVANQVLVQANSWVNDARVAAALATQVEHSFAVDVYNESLAFTQHAYDTAVSYAGSLAAIEEQHLASAVTQLEAYSVAVTNQGILDLVTDVDTAISGAVTDIWTDVDGAISDVIGVLGTDDPDILSAIKSLDLTIPGSIAAVASLAGVTTLTLARYLRDCGLPNCKNLSQFGQDLQQLLGLANDAAFLEFLLSLVHNPGNAASTVDNAFGDLIGDAISSARSLIGV